MTNHELCFQRDNAIIEYLENYGALDINQLHCQFFPSLRMAQRRMQVLATKGKVKRDYYAKRLYYYVDKKPECNQIGHRLAVNWCRMLAEKSARNGVKMHNWMYEPNFVIIRPDAMYSTKNEWRKADGKEYEFYCVEIDLSPNPFDKVQKYNKWFENLGNAWFTQYAYRFPEVNIITYDEVRELKIQEHIRNENKHGLRFTTKTLDSIIRECVRI